MKNILVIWVIFVVSVWAEPVREKISVQLQWADQFQFAGYYVAKERGYYADVGLDVTIRKFDPKKLTVDEVLSGRSEYGIGRSSLLIDRMRGKEVVALSAIFQSSPFILLSKKSLGIRTPKDLIGKRIMMTSDFQDSISVRAMLNSQNVRMDQLHFLEHSYDPMDIANGKTDVMACYISNEPYILKEKGVETNAINPEEYGFDFYSDILFTSEKEVRNHPKRVQAFVDATLKGWEYAFGHIDETARLIKARYDGQHKSLPSLIYEGEVLKSLAYHDNVPLGAITLRKFQRISDIYKVMGIPQNEQRFVGFIYDDVRNRSLPLSIDERSFLHSKTIRYISTSTWPPFNFRNETDGRFGGIANDFWNLIVQRSGMKSTFIEADNWKQVLDAIRFKTADLTLGTSTTPEKEHYALFSKPYASFPNVIVTDKSIDFLPGLSALAGKRLAIGEGYGVAELIAKKYPAIHIVFVKDTKEGLKQLSGKKVDAVVDILPVVAYLINSGHYVDLKISGTTEFQFDVRMMIRKDYPELKSIVDKGIDSISSEERERIFNRYISVTYEESIDYDWVYGIGIAALLIIALFVYRQFEMGRYNQKLLRLATTDPLTQIANRIRLNEKLTSCHQASNRSGHNYSVIILDLDHFKQINDQYGHLSGDGVLKTIANVLEHSVRQTDLVGRWGGEEFMIICPETDLSGAKHVARKVQSMILRAKFGPVHTVSASFGISESRSDDRVEDVVSRADEALYRAKNEGRNRICEQ
ncbi:MAG: ABC transporter substrate-binding protein [Sulfuricurvum sp.]